MANTLSEVYAQLPSPPLSPSKICHSDHSSDGYNDNEKDYTKNEIQISSPVEPSEEDILRDKYVDIMENGVFMHNEIIPCSYFVEKLHEVGQTLLNQKTEDAVPLRVYEIGKNSYEEYWVHPMFLILQSFEFFKIFEEYDNEANEQDIIEIEVPSLKTFSYLLYYLYTGDNTEILKLAKLDENISKGIMDNLEFLEIYMDDY